MFFHFVLQVTAGHVQAHGIAIDVLRRVGRRNVAPTFANGHHQFDFVVQVLREARVRHGTGLARFDHHQTVVRFEEEERRLAPCKAHLLGVFFIIAAHTINAVHWKTFGLAQHRHRDPGHG